MFTFGIGKSDTNTYPIAAYTLHDYAEHLGLDIQQYMKLTGAMRGNIDTVIGFKYESIRDKPAYIEMMNLMNSGQDVPHKLQNEVNSMFRHNLDNLADFVGVPKTQISDIVKKYNQMVNTVNSLENIRLARQDDQSYTIQVDEIERIVVTAPLDSIHLTSSGLYTLYTYEIWDYGIEVGGGSRVSVQATFVNSADGSTFGTQSWAVDRFSAAPTENLVCSSTECELAPL